MRRISITTYGATLNTVWCGAGGESGGVARWWGGGGILLPVLHSLISKPHPGPGGYQGVDLRLAHGEQWRGRTDKNGTGTAMNHADAKTYDPTH